MEMCYGIQYENNVNFYFIFNFICSVHAQLGMSSDVNLTLLKYDFVFPKSPAFLAWCFVCRALVENGLAGTGQLLENVVNAALLCFKFEPNLSEGLFRLFPPHYVIAIIGTHHIETFLNLFFNL